MANEISSSVTAARLSVAGYSATGVSPGREGVASTQADKDMLPSQSRDRVAVDAGVYSRLSEIKDQAVQAAGAIREADKMLDQADKLLGDMQQQVQLVKNFPPLPPGNEERADYIKSLSGLRKVFDALTVPPPQEPYEPVFYPRDANLSDLDPTSASDEDVMALGRAVEAAQSKINEAYVALQAQAEKINADSPQLPSEDQARALSLQIGVQVGAGNRGLAGGTVTLI